MLRIKELRRKKGLLQLEFARAVGVAQATVSTWEDGSCDPSAHKLPKIAEVLECSIDDLFKKNDE